MLLEKYLIKKYNLPINNKIITPCDYVKFYINFDNYKNELYNFILDSLTIKYKINEIEESILYFETHKYRHLMDLVSQTHFSCYLHDIYFILSNIEHISHHSEKNYFIDKFNRLYEQKEEINNIANYTINNFNKLINRNYKKSDKYNMIEFYNELTINLFIDSLKYKKPKIDKNLDKTIQNKIMEIYTNYLIPSSNLIINFLEEKLKNGIFKKKSNKNGLSNFNPKLYLFFINYQTGIKLKNTNDIEFLYKWAYEYLNYNIQKKIDIINKIYPNENKNSQIIVRNQKIIVRKQQITLSDSIITTYNKLVKILYNDPKYNFTSKNEFLECYTNAVKKYSEFINIYNIPYKYKCCVKKFSNKNVILGYYSDNCFYINISLWKESRKYEVRSLTLHESYPGHHIQLDISHNFSENKYLLKLYSSCFNSFKEGWALFAENLYNSDDNNLGDTFGLLDSDTLRIYRIIADIDIHYYGKPLEEITKQMAQYVALDINCIKVEIYRYSVLPAQAISYKIGQNAFMAIYNKFKNKYKKKNYDLLINDQIMFDIYKKILLNGETSIDKLVNKYKINTVFDIY